MFLFCGLSVEVHEYLELEEGETLLIRNAKIFIEIALAIPLLASLLQQLKTLQIKPRKKDVFLSNLITNHTYLHQGLHFHHNKNHYHF